MKRFFILSIVMMLGIMLSAQTQQGYVKTKGRMVNGKLVHGQGLKGATVSVRGRTTVLVNANDGAFSFPVPEKQFRLDSVRKKGYQLVDMDALGKTYKHSSNPLYLVMETPEQMIDDQMDNFNRINASQQAIINKLRAEVNQLKAQNKINEEEYGQRLAKIAEIQSESQNLVNEMAERYSKIDFDQLDEFNRQVSWLILNGELIKADSLIKSKGNMEERSVELDRIHEANTKEEAKLEQSKKYEAKTLEDFAADCYSLFEICKLKHENDSAAYWLELRASKDTTNVEWACDAAEFISDYLSKFDEALQYFNKSLQTCLLLFGEYNPDVAKLYNNIGQIYSLIGDDEKALELIEKSIAISKHFEGLLLTDSAPYNNMACSYYNLGQTEKAISYFEKAIEIDFRVYGEGHVNLATTYNNLGIINDNNNRFEDALEFYRKALDIYIKNYGENNLNVANTYNNIGMSYFNQMKYDEALVYLNKALTIQESILDTIHKDIGISYNNIASAYGELGDVQKCMEYREKSLKIKTAIYGENSLEIAYDYNNMGVMLQRQGKYEESLEFQNQAYQIRKSILGEDHIQTLYSYYNIASVYKDLGRNDEALSMFNKCLNAFTEKYGEQHSSVASAYIGIGNVYKNWGNYELMLKNYDKALKIRQAVFGEDNPITIQTQQKISEIQSKLKEQENKPTE